MMKHAVLYTGLAASLVLPAAAQSVPTISSANPGGAPVGSPDLPVSLFVSSTGSPAVQSVTVLWNGVPRPTKSGNSITVTLSAADLAAPGLNEITVYDNNSGTMWPGGYKFPVFLPLSANDLVYDVQRDRIYGSVPSTGGTYGNKVVAINPQTGDITASVFAGSEPNRLAITDDNQWLYVFNDGASSIVRIALNSFNADPPFSTGGGPAQGGLNTTTTMSAVPGSPNSILVGQNGTFKIFDNGTARSKSAGGSGRVAWLGPTTFVNSTPQMFTISPSGVAATSLTGGGNGGYVQDVAAGGGLVFLSNGQVFQASNLALLGKFNGAGLVAIDADNGLGRAYFLGGGPSNGSSSYAISAFDIGTYVPQGFIPIPSFDNIYGNTVSRLLRFGADGIAFSYRGQQFVSNFPDKVFVFHSHLFGSAPVIPSASIVNAASVANGPVAPGEIVSIYGQGLGPGSPRGLQLAAPGRVDTAAGDTRVFFNGIPAAVLFTSAGQVNCVVPYSIGRATSVTVQVTYLGIASTPAQLTVQAANPAIFTTGSGATQAAAFNQDGSLNSASKPAARGSVVTLFATGEGQTNPAGSDGTIAAFPAPQPVQSVKAAIDGIDAVVTYAGGAPGLVAGVMQVNVTVPAGARTGAAVPMTISVGSFASPAGTTIAVQ